MNLVFYYKSIPLIVRSSKHQNSYCWPFGRDDAKSPSFWSQVCLHNMAKLGKEATTMRRVLESLFRNFDSENLWPFSQGVAYPVLKDMQIIMDESGNDNTY